MPWTYVECPKCGAEVSYHVIEAVGGCWDERVIEFIDQGWSCDCHDTMTDDEIDAIEQRAIARTDWEEAI